MLATIKTEERSIAELEAVRTDIFTNIEILEPEIDELKDEKKTLKRRLEN